MKTRIIVMLSVLMLSLGCKSTMNAKTSEGEIKYRLIMSFISKGEGTDKTVATALESLILTFNQKNETNVVYERYQWGKEGEYDLCFPFDGVKKGLQKDFVEAVKNLTKSSSSVIIKEKEACRHKPKTENK